MTMPLIKSYSELLSYPSYEERFKYLRLNGKVSDETFGAKRWLNQVFYKSPEWLKFRSEIIVRDCACDLGVEGRDIYSGALIHHINPITIEDIANRNLDVLLNPENVITTTSRTHNAIHYGDDTILKLEMANRTPNDTIPWR